MYRNVFMWGALLAMLLSACQNHFISDANERKEVEQTFERRKEVLKDTHIFDVFTETMTREENEAMRFMYAYMPLGDLTDYPGEFHLGHVKAALRARAEMPWGKDIPEREFRHFVLPYRVNNENMDSARIVFYRELKPRIENMSLKEAVLEINHWCHEKVAYTPSDMRTSAPLASVRTAYGRCGEESTFAVSAFRAMGIPARQVYTPRWAHTDDNHAWVEVWVDGKWHFLGACEPEPVLDLAWFNAPASRGMLMHTKVFGHYHGPEEVMETTDNYTEINVIDNYADTATTTVTVTSPNGQPVEGALVEFKRILHCRTQNDRRPRPSLPDCRTGRHARVGLDERRPLRVQAMFVRERQRAYHHPGFRTNRTNGPGHHRARGKGTHPGRDAGTTRRK